MKQLAMFLMVLFAGSTYAEQSTIATLPLNLHNGGFVVVMRHASSPRELPDA